MTESTNDPQDTSTEQAAEVPNPDTAPTTPTTDTAATGSTATGSTAESTEDAPHAGDSIGTDDLGVDDDLGAEALGGGAIDPDIPSAAGSSGTAAEDMAGDFAGAQAEGEHSETTKAYLGRPELTPLYAMAGLADLAANVVRDIANEQIAAFRARRQQAAADAEAGATDADADPSATDSPSEQQRQNEQFNAFLAKAQERTQELFDQAMAQYEHLADRGRVAVGDAFDSAKEQRAKAGAKASEGAEKAGDKAEEAARASADDVSAAADRFAERVAAAARTAADRVSRATQGKGDTSADAEAAETVADKADAAAAEADAAAEAGDGEAPDEGGTGTAWTDKS